MLVPTRSLSRLAACALALAACAKSSPTPGGLGDPCLANTDCATGFLCSGGECVLPANLGGCEAGRTRCNGDDVEQCDPTGETWQTVSTCATGCISGGCAPQICTPNAFRCDGDASEECTPSGNAWAFVQECASHCDQTTGQCKAPTCTPFATTCSADGLSIVTCDSFGASQTSTACATGSVCEAGRCVQQVCTPGAQRCDSSAVEQCALDGSAWLLLDLCASGCAQSGLAAGGADAGSSDGGASTASCLAPVCTPFAVQCSADDKSVMTCSSNGSAFTSTACGSGLICDTGRCQTVVCTPGAVRCAAGNGSLETCNALGDGWNAGQSCAHSCGQGSSGAACLAAVCEVGDTRCDGNALEGCLPDETGWSFESFCATGCSGTGAGSADAGQSASCNPLVCSPLTRRCDPDNPTAVDTCSQLGTEWDPTDLCPQGCAAGQCVTTSANCTVGDLRCNGIDTQACNGVSGAPGVTEWDTTGTCLNGCSSGACLPGGSCASVDGGAQLVVLHLGAPMNDAGVPTAPADGKSSVLVYSDAIVGETNAPIADGTLFTVAATLPGGASDGGAAQVTISTADADPSTPGNQVATEGGRLRFTVAVPALAQGGSGTMLITAQLEQGGSCNATTQLALSTDPSVLVTALLAEDFSTTTNRDPSTTTANWSTTQQALIGTWPDPIASGGDGSYTLSNSTTLNLATSGFAPAFAVLGLSTQTVTLDGVAQGLSGGDEVLLWDAQGSSQGTGNAGTYELLTVQSTSGATVTFTTPIQNDYGAAADQDVSTQRVSLQRVPHFNVLTVPGGSTLTTSAWDGTKGGLIFLRAQRLVLGGAPTGQSPALVEVSGLGFRGGAGGASATQGEDQTGVAGQDGPGGGGGAAGATASGASYGTAGSGAAPGAIYGSKALGKLFLGSGGGGSTNGNAGGAGGGAAVLFADSIDFTVSSGASTVGLVRANGGSAGASAGSGSGGTIWIGSPNFLVGPGNTNVLSASGGAGGVAGGAGRIRVDEETVDSPGFGTACARATPACNFGVNGAVQGQSVNLYTVSGTQTAVTQANLLVGLDANSSVKFFASAVANNGFLQATPASCPAELCAVFNPTGAATPGPQFRWQVQLSPDPLAGPSEVTGLQWQLLIK